MEIPRFRKRPVVIEAMRVPSPTGDEELVCWGHLTGWLATKGADFQVAPNGAGVEIKTLEGTMRAETGDWIIRGVKGEFYPCKPDIFAQTYEHV
jgi:hypothetical protein